MAKQYPQYGKPVTGVPIPQPGSGHYPPPSPPVPIAYPYPMTSAPLPITEYPVVSVRTMSVRNATTAQVSISQSTGWNVPPDYQFEAGESAKREQGDRYDQAAGELLAVGRALQALGRQMISEANKRVEALNTPAPRRSRPQTYHRTREEWALMQSEKAQAGAEKIAENLGLTRDQFVTREEVRAAEGGSPRHLDIERPDDPHSAWRK